MHPNWPELCQHIFTSSAALLREYLYNWSENERKSCFQAHKNDLNQLRKSCHYSEHTYILHAGHHPFGWNSQAEPRFGSVQQLWPVLQQELEKLSDYLEREKVSVYAAADMYFLALNLETVWAGLCDKRSALALAKSLRNAPTLPYFLLENENGSPRQDPPETHLFSVTQILLNRPVDWAESCLVKLFEDYQEQYLGQGYYPSVCSVLKTWPEKEALFQPALEKSLFMELYLWRDKLQELPLTHILAGLSWRNQLNQGPLRGRHFPLNLNAEPLGLWLRQTLPADVPNRRSERLAFLSLALTRLLENSRKEDNRDWLALYTALEPSEQEIISLKNLFFQLLQASTPNGISLALETVKKYFNGFETEHSQIPDSIIPHLSHPVQKVAKESLALLKQYAKTWPEKKPELLLSLLPQLASPHGVIRQDLLKWFKGQSLPASAQRELQVLKESGLLSPLEQEQLRALLPDNSEPTAKAESKPESKPETTQPIKSLQSYFPTVPINQHHWDSDPRLEIPSDEASLSALLLKYSHQSPPDSIHEAVGQALLRLGPPQDPVYQRRHLDPLLQKLQCLKNLSPSPLMDVSHLLLAILAQAWIEQKPPEIAPQVWERLAMAAPNLCAGVQSSLKALIAGANSRIEAPEFLTGWISLQVFVKRLKDLPVNCLDTMSLTLALRRLSPEPVKHVWPDIQVLKARFPEPEADLLTLALGPDDAAELALKHLSKAFKKTPPDDFLLEQLYYSSSEKAPSPTNPLFRGILSAAGARQRREGLSPSLFQALLNLPWDNLCLNLGMDPGIWLSPQPDSEENTQTFWGKLSDGISQLFSGSGTIEKHTEAEPEVSALSEQENEALDNWLNKLHLAQKERALKIKTFKQLEPALQKQIQGLLLGDTNWLNLPEFALGETRQFERTPFWPQLWPLAIALNPRYQPHWGLPFNPESQLYPKLAEYPVMAQMLFDIALLKLRWKQREFGGMSRADFQELQKNYWREIQNGNSKATPPPWSEQIPELEKYDHLLLLLHLGHLPRIVLQEGVRSMLQVLSAKHPEQRQVVLDLIWQGLEDGRIQVSTVVEQLSHQFASQSKGLLYLRDSLQNWELRGEAGYNLILTILDHFWSTTSPTASPPVPPKNLSTLLEWSYQLWQSGGPYQLSASALNGLQKWADHPKKTAGREKARALLVFFKNGA
jgi:hypothetical protein